MYLYIVVYLEKNRHASSEREGNLLECNPGVVFLKMDFWLGFNSK